MRLRTATTAAAIGLAAFTSAGVLWWQLGPQASAARTPALEEALTFFTERRTLYAAMGNMTVRADLWGPNLAVEATKNERWWLRWDGTTLVFHDPPKAFGAPVPPPLELPQLWSDRLAEFWVEMRAGFPNSTFREELPSTVSPSWEPERPGDRKRWYRVDPPFTWDDSAAIYVSLFESPGQFYSIEVFNIETGEPFEWRGNPTDRLGVFAESDGMWHDVPLHPDVYSLDGPTRDHRVRLFRDGSVVHTLLPYHQQLTRSPLAYQESVSNGSTAEGFPLEGVAYTLRPCSTAPRTYAHSAHLRWRLTDEPVQRQRVVDALAGCPEVTLRITPFLDLVTDSTSTVCIDGTFRILDASTEPPGVVVEKSISPCRTGGSSHHRQEFLVEEVLRSTLSVEHLAVTFDGTASITCHEVGTTPNGASLGMGLSRGPTLFWEECIPGWTSDGDADEVQDYRDVCPTTALHEAIDHEGCSVHDRCPCVGPWHNHGQYVSCVTEAANELMQAGTITGREKGELTRDAGRSSCGT